MSESRPGSRMASGAVLHPSARVVESQSRTRRVRDRERGREGTERTKDRDMGSILVDYQTEELETSVRLLILQAERENVSGQIIIGDRMYGEERSM